MLDLSAPQNVFLNGLNTKWRAYVGGFGSGKTFVGCLDLLLFAGKHPKTVQGYFAPTYPVIRDIFYETISEAASLLQFTAEIRESNHEVILRRGPHYYGTIICRSMDNPASIVGFKIARALVDEIDILPADKATQAWRKIIARMRLVVKGAENGIGVTTTPEGFKFVHSTFAKEPTESYSMVQASTYENEQYLPSDYISSLIETYPENLIDAYLRGKFVNLVSGTVYKNFDRTLNHNDRVWDGKEPVYVGLDFNVGKMAAVIHVKDNKKPRAVDEIYNAYDTPEVIGILQQRYPQAQIRIYPDASGKSRKSVNASTSDLSLLSQAGFSVIANKKNPFVKDRVLSMNQMFCDNKGERHYLVNTDKCPNYADCLEQQIYAANGEPDKTQGKDHAVDAAGYFLAYDYPINKPAAVRLSFAI